MVMNVTETTRCTDCGVQLEVDEAASPTYDNRPRCDGCHWSQQAAMLSVPRHKRFLHDVTCTSCGAEFVADSHSLAPEGCPHCGFLDVARPAPVRTPRLLRAAHAHLTGGDERLAMMTGKYLDGTPVQTLSTLRRERASK